MSGMIAANKRPFQVTRCRLSCGSTERSMAALAMHVLQHFTFCSLQHSLLQFAMQGLHYLRFCGSIAPHVLVAPGLGSKRAIGLRGC